MSSRRLRSRDDRKELPPLVDSEWVGGRFPVPRLDPQAEEPAPELFLWLDLDGNRLVQALSPAPALRAPFAFSLLRAMVQPASGFPRQPRRVRVADASLAQELGGFQGEFELAVAPAPEIEEAFEELRAALEGDIDDECSYFEDATIGEPAVAELFAAAAELFRAAPWEVLGDSQVLEVDIPAFDVRGACLSVIAGQEPDAGDCGLCVYESQIEYEMHQDALAAMDGDETELDHRVRTLSLTFRSRDELPQQMRRETARHGWPVAAAGAYPFAEIRSRYGIAQALREDELRTLAACARAAVAFVREHRSRLPTLDFGTLEGEYRVGEDVEVRVAANIEDWMAGHDWISQDDEELPPEPLVLGPRVGRNDPCPCGSGKKYKKCCLAKDEAARRKQRERW